MDLVCSVQLGTIETELSYSRLKKWHYVDLVFSVYVLTIKSGLVHSTGSCLKKWHFLDLVCSLQVVIITTGLRYSNRSRL